jgi:hypothetical protein
MLQIQNIMTPGDGNCDNHLANAHQYLENKNVHYFKEIKCFALFKKSPKQDTEE